VKSIATLPNLLTLANAACGFLAISKAIDALSIAGDDGDFYERMRFACFLVFLAMIFDGLDGMVARLTKTTSEFGAQLDSFADAITFGIAPAILAKALIQHEGPLLGYDLSPRLSFAACACYALLAILRLARFNLESGAEQKKGKFFRGLPSPGAAGSVASLIWIYLVLHQPNPGADEGVAGLMRTIAQHDFSAVLGWMPPLLLLWMPLLGLLMVSRIRYPHGLALLSSERSNFFNLVAIVFIAGALYLAPVPLLFGVFHVGIFSGLVRAAMGHGRGAEIETEGAG
jgi:CDP-diacylglycerol--serine O-phosphatidyltransferase